MTEKKIFVLDASAFLALVNNENVNSRDYFEHCYMSSINAAECMIVLNRNGMPIDVAESLLKSIVMKFFDVALCDIAEVTAIKNSNQDLGLSMGDSFYLALGKKLNLPVLTADKVWKNARDVHAVVVIR